MDTLTEEQVSAARHKKGPACVIAGAGTGKTHTLTERICFLIENLNIEPSRIRVTTFTRKATAELYHRVHERLGDVASQLRISTIDALIWDLAQEAMHNGFMRSAQLIGEASQRILLLEAAFETFGPKDRSLKILWIDYVDKAKLLNLLEACIRIERTGSREKRLILRSISAKLKDLRNKTYLSSYFYFFPRPTVQALKQAVKKYLEKLDRFGAMDYDLLSSQLLHCLNKHPQRAKDFASQTDAILMDEFQDTSSIQAEILCLLAGKRRHIWVVGDQCQQIYEWRGAGPQNLLRFRKSTRAREYYLAENQRSRQPILDAAYSFLGRWVPPLKRTGMLRPLKFVRSHHEAQNDEPVYTGTLDRALWLARQRLNVNPHLRPGDIAILSRELGAPTVKRIQQKATEHGLKVQFHSSRAEFALEQTISPNGIPPNWKAGRALDNLYSYPLIQRRISHALRRKKFDELRLLRPLATAAEAFDSSSSKLNFREAWPALKKTQDREVQVTPAVASRPDEIQVMTIHAAKGLEFPVVLLTTLGKKFPNPEDPEDSRLIYVGATRARDVLILVHTDEKPIKTLSAFGKALAPIGRVKTQAVHAPIQAPSVIDSPPLIAATHLDYYEQCPLKFAAYHEGRYLPKWSPAQSRGSRMHKAIEYYLRAGVPRDKQIIAQCFREGFRHGDSPLRKLSSKMEDRMKRGYQEITKHIRATSTRILEVEKRYRYVHGHSGQVEGVIDAVIEQHDGIVALKEWKTSSGIRPERERQYQLQARVGAMAAQGARQIQLIEIVPILRPEKTISILYDKSVVDESTQMLEQVFKDLRDRNYEPRKGKYCNQCDLKPECPAWA